MRSFSFSLYNYLNAIPDTTLKELTENKKYIYELTEKFYPALWWNHDSLLNNNYVLGQGCRNLKTKITFMNKETKKINDLLLPGGRFIADSTDVKYLYEDEDGGYWLDLNSAYYGNFKFQMQYKKISGPEFEWLYVDYDTLHEHATACGFKCRRAYTIEENFLAVLEKI